MCGISFRILFATALTRYAFGGLFRNRRYFRRFCIGLPTGIGFNRLTVVAFSSFACDRWFMNWSGMSLSPGFHRRFTLFPVRFCGTFGIVPEIPFAGSDQLQVVPPR